MITPEMVEKAGKALAVFDDCLPFCKDDAQQLCTCRAQARVVLAAVLPDIVEQCARRFDGDEYLPQIAKAIRALSERNP